MVFSQWWFWVLAIPLGGLAVGLVAVVSQAIVKLAKLKYDRGPQAELTELRQRLEAIQERLDRTQAVEKMLAFQKQLSQRDLRAIERKTLPEGVAVFLFTDIEGFTRLLDQHGDEGGFQLLQRHHRLMRAAVERHGGLEVKQLGDGFMFCFSSAKKALRCAVELQAQLKGMSPPLQVRMGLHAGEPIQSERDFIGQTVNLAERVMEQADGGRVFLSEVVKNLAGPLAGFQYVDQGRRRLAGVSEPQQLYQFVRVEALSHPLDSQLDRQLESLEERWGGS